jgi:hypothetical protein
MFGGAPSDDVKRRSRDYGLKDRIKSFGRNFVLLKNVTEEGLRTNILVCDNGFTDTSHVLTAVRRAREIFVNPRITLITFQQRKEHFSGEVPEENIIVVAQGPSSFKLAIKMLGMRGRKFDRVILTALDMFPVAAVFASTRAQVLLYNQWHQWWSLRSKNLLELIGGLARFVISMPILIYLIIVSSFILARLALRKQANAFKAAFVTR